MTSPQNTRDIFGVTSTTTLTKTETATQSPKTLDIDCQQNVQRVLAATAIGMMTAWF